MIGCGFFHRLSDVSVLSRSIHNEPPEAYPDSFVAYASVRQQLDVIANDTDPEGHLLRLVAADATFGDASIVDGQVSYLAPNNFVGEDQISYRIIDTYGAPADQISTVTVAPSPWDIEVGPENSLSLVKLVPDPIMGELHLDFTASAPPYNKVYAVDLAALAHGPVFLEELALTDPIMLGETLNLRPALIVSDAPGGLSDVSFSAYSRDVEDPTSPETLMSQSTSAEVLIPTEAAEKWVRVQQNAVDASGSAQSSIELGQIPAAPAINSIEFIAPDGTTLHDLDVPVDQQLVLVGGGDPGSYIGSNALFPMASIPGQLFVQTGRTPQAHWRVTATHTIVANHYNSAVGSTLSGSLGFYHLRFNGIEQAWQLYFFPTAGAAVLLMELADPSFSPGDTRESVLTLQAEQLSVQIDGHPTQAVPFILLAGEFVDPGNVQPGLRLYGNTPQQGPALTRFTTELLQ